MNKIIIVIFIFFIFLFQSCEIKKDNVKNPELLTEIFTENQTDILLENRFNSKKITINGMEYLLLYGDLDTPPFVINLTNDKLLNQFLINQLNQ